MQESWPILSILQILILGYDNDVDTSADAVLGAVVRHQCHSLDHQFFEDECVFIDPTWGRPYILLIDLLYKIVDLDNIFHKNWI